MWFKFVLLIGAVICISIVAPTTNAKGNPPLCCGDTNFIKDHVCDFNGVKSSILLQCDKYKLDPDDGDEFTILENGDLDHGTGSTISADGYCITNQQSVNRTNETTEVALVCFVDTRLIFLIKGVMAIISVVFLLLTLYVYWVIPDLRETQDKVTCFTLICLTTFMFFLGIIQIVEPEILTQTVLCTPFAYIVYYFSIAYFTWLNLIMLNVWKNSVVPRWNIREKDWYFSNHLYGWLVPTTLTAIVLATANLEGGYNPGFGEISCWFEESLETWIFLYTPISIMLILNIILFAWSAWGIHSHGNDISPDKKRALIYKFKLYLKLFILAGFTWIFEVLSYHFQKGFHISYWFITDTLNALHGVLIFCVLIVWRRRVRKELQIDEYFALEHHPLGQKTEIQNRNNLMVELKQNNCFLFDSIQLP